MMGLLLSACIENGYVATSQDTSLEDTAITSTDTGQDSGLDTSQQDTNDSAQDTAEVDDTAEELVNNSETPPTGSCNENTVQVQLSNQTYFIRNFLWEMGEDNNGPKIFMAGYNSGDIDVCEGLDQDAALDHAQINITISPRLSQLPQQVGLGIPGYTENVAGKVTFIADPLAEDLEFFWAMEGEAWINSFLENEKSLISEMHIGIMGYDNSNGNLSDFVEVGIVFSGGQNMIGCYCEGLIDYYKGL